MPPRARTKVAEKPQTTQQRLAAVIKRCRDIMRIDAGLNGDLDRLPQMAWLLFLKAFDDLEERRAVLDEDHRPAIEAPYRWRDWARPATPTGDDLLEFVNTKLLPYLRSLPAGDGLSAEDKITAIFQGLDNRMRNGYQLRELINELEKIHFDSADDIHTMAHLYESMLREVRDAAGDSGEFYTPRPLVRFMVQQVNPRLGDVVLDPAAGTGGFLIESLEHLHTDKLSVAQRAKLYSSLRGFEKKNLPFLLSTMNMLLHGVDAPRIFSANALEALRPPLPKSSLVDVVLTNPPFGGAESAETAKGFPKGVQTAETAWLFLYTVMEALKPGGRCGIVVPNSVMFDTGIGSRIKKHLFETCDLHTVVRLPDAVFAPYTDIPSNLLFFEKGRPTKEVWFYRISPPQGRKKYSKTRPMQFEEFDECQQWWGGDRRTGRAANKHAWKMEAAALAEDGYNLDRKNPNQEDDLSHRPPIELLDELIALDGNISRQLRDLRKVLAGRNG